MDVNELFLIVNLRLKMKFFFEIYGAFFVLKKLFGLESYSFINFEKVFSNEISLFLLFLKYEKILKQEILNYIFQFYL